MRRLRTAVLASSRSASTSICSAAYASGVGPSAVGGVVTGSRDIDDLLEGREGGLIGR